MRAAGPTRESRTTPLRALARAAFLFAWTAVASASQIDIPAPPGSGFFMYGVVVLPNGNLVVADAFAGDADEGAVYLYSPTGTLISTLRGSSPNDQVGGDIVVLANSNFLVRSAHWNNGSAIRAGAVTWVDGTSGLDGVVSPANSLVGSSTDDQIGMDITVLANGNCVVSAYDWDNGTLQDAGAATFVPADGGVHGPVSAANSLVGSSANDTVGDRIVPLTNGNYLVVSPYWTNGDIPIAGAVTWASGETGIVGPISAQNSLVGSTTRDGLGMIDVYIDTWALSNGNAVVISPDWDNGMIVNAGAVTWIDGTTGLTGTISAANSLVGTTAGDRLGETGVWGFFELPGGHFAVVSPSFSSPGAAHAGAITWGDTTTAIRGVVSASNSLLGSTNQDLVAASIVALDDGNWVVGSPSWSNDGAFSVGAATWIDASAPLVGPISTANSLVGGTQGDHVGQQIVALNDGRYLVASPMWTNGSAGFVGAVTWVDRQGLHTGSVSADNSLVGTNPGDEVGESVSVLANGNYVVSSSRWARDSVQLVGAVTLARGDIGMTGQVSTANSLVGDEDDDRMGLEPVPLSNGNFVALSPLWHGQLGAATLIDGQTGRIETVSAQNSLVGSVPHEGPQSVTVLNRTGNYLVVDSDWNNLLGAVAWGNGRTGVVGEISATNSLVGTSTYYSVGTDVVAADNGNAIVTGHSSVTLVRGTSPTVGPVNSANSALNPNASVMSYEYDEAHDRLFVLWSDGTISIFQTDGLLENGFD